MYKAEGGKHMECAEVPRSRLRSYGQIFVSRRRLAARTEYGYVSGKAIIPGIYGVLFYHTPGRDSTLTVILSSDCSLQHNQIPDHSNPGQNVADSGNSGYGGVESAA